MLMIQFSTAETINQGDLYANQVLISAQGSLRIRCKGLYLSSSRAAKILQVHGGYCYIIMMYAIGH